jgi:glycosyltransferase involved in cell wall biosynthesis
VERTLSAPRRVLFLTQWFEPEPIMKGVRFAQGLQEAGFEVEVATGFPNYPTGKLAAGYRLRPHAAEIMEGVRVHRLFLIPSHDASALGRAANYLSFFVSALIFCLFCGRRFDALYVYHPPITVGLAAAVSSAFTRTPFILDVQDLWPDSVTASGIGGAGRLGGILGRLCAFVYRRAALVIAQSRAMGDVLVDRGVPPDRAVTIFNWADEDAARARGEFDVSGLGFDGRFNIVFGGNIGRVQDMETVVRAAVTAARKVPDLLLTVVGDGVERDRLAALIQEVGGPHVRLLEAVPRTQIGDIFAAADVLILHLLDDPLFAMTIPSKLQFYLAMGRPVLAAVRGEAAEIVTGCGAGLAATPQDVAAVAEVMVRMARLKPEERADMGARARAAYEARFSYATAMAQTRACLERLGASS